MGLCLQIDLVPQEQITTRFGKACFSHTREQRGHLSDDAERFLMTPIRHLSNFLLERERKQLRKVSVELLNRAKWLSQEKPILFGTRSRLKHSGWTPHQTSLWLICMNSTFGLLLVALCVQNVFTTCSPGVHQVFTTLQNTSFEGSSVNWQQNFHSQLAGTNNWRFPQYFLDPPTEFWLLFRVF